MCADGIHLCHHEIPLQVSGVKVAKPEEIKTVPGTNIQSDETEEFDRIYEGRSQLRSLLEELREKLPDVEVSYSYGYYVLQER